MVIYQDAQGFRQANLMYGENEPNYFGNMAVLIKQHPGYI
jgi:hypothetical protein